MAFQVKVEYGGTRFAAFLLENISYDGLVSSSIKKNCSSLAHLDADKIRLRYGYGERLSSRFFFFAFSPERLRTAKEVKDHDYKKTIIQSKKKLTLRARAKWGECRFGLENTGDELRCLEPKQLSYHTSTFPSASFTDEASASPTSARNDQQGRSPLDSKQQEMKFSVTVLKVQVATAKEELQKLNQLENEYMTLASLPGRVCNDCRTTGHTKPTRHSPPCSNIDQWKIKDKHPVHKIKVNELQREIKSLESQAEDRGRGKHQTLSKRTGAR